MALGVALLTLGGLFLTTLSRPLVAVAAGTPVSLTIAYLLLWLLLAAAWLLVRYMFNAATSG